MAILDDFTRSYNDNEQTDVAILDFSKAFDTVPHKRLLQKVEAYGIRGSLHKWTESFLCTRHMKVVIDRELSEEQMTLHVYLRAQCLVPSCSSST